MAFVSGVGLVPGLPPACLSTLLGAVAMLIQPWVPPHLGCGVAQRVLARLLPCSLFSGIFFFFGWKWACPTQPALGFLRIYRLSHGLPALLAGPGGFSALLSCRTAKSGWPLWGGCEGGAATAPGKRPSGLWDPTWCPHPRLTWSPAAHLGKSSVPTSGRVVFSPSGGAPA